MQWSSSAIDDGGGGNHARNDDVEDNFEPSLFAEHPLLPLHDDVHTTFLAANLLMLYLNLARLSSMPSGDVLPVVTIDDRDDRENDNNNK